MLRVWTIPAGVPFADALAQGLLVKAGSDPLALADMLVLLPNRRACRSLRDAFLRASDRSALILPRMQPIGDLDPDELLIDGEAELDLPPAIGPLQRRLLLTRMLQPLGWSVDHAGQLAEDLAALLDELQAEDVAFSALDQLVPDHLATHWQKNRELLALVAQHWPRILENLAVVDPAKRCRLILEAVATRWRAEPPPGAVIAAGTTGSTRAVRDLLAVIARLPRGEIVLPGLDQVLDLASWELIDPAHPQYLQKQLLTVLGVARGEVRLWPATRDSEQRQARRRFFSEVMRPAATIFAWRNMAPVPPLAIEGLHIAEYPDMATEATAIALRLRAAMEQPGRTAGLVTPDRQLARRVAAELARFGITIDDSAGVPLDRTAPGSFLLLTARLVIEGVAPVALLAALKHPLARAGLPPQVMRRRVRSLERLCLRGPRIAGGFRAILSELDGLRRRTASDDIARLDQILELRGWLDGLALAAAPFAELVRQGPAPLQVFLEAHLRFAQTLAASEDLADALWSKEAGEALASLMAELLESTDGDIISPAAYPALIARLMADRSVRPLAPPTARLHLWGQLEARLQQADLLILGGLNEGVWPRIAEPGPWLNPAMRAMLDLPPVEKRLGQAAHDFVQAACSDEVLLCRAQKDFQGNPTVPSRWLTRITALLEGQKSLEQVSDSSCWTAWAQALDRPKGKITPASQPRPCPPLAARPRELWVSDIGRWLANPYEIYARRILNLTPLEPLEADPGALERGTIIHAALERFVRHNPSELPADAYDQLVEFGRHAFERLRQRPQVQAIWWPRFLQIARWVVQEEAQRRATLEWVWPEVKGELVVDRPEGPIRITARADRIEQRQDGAITVVDYKTGALPKPEEVTHGRAPQLPLEGLMVMRGEFDPPGRSALAGLDFWQLKGDESGGLSRPAASEKSARELAAQAEEGLLRLLTHFDRPDVAYHAVPRPAVARRGDYDHLARLGEWPN